MRSNDEITTQSGWRRWIRSRSAAIEVSPNTGIPSCCACATTGSAAAVSTLRTTPTTRQRVASDCSALCVVGPMPISRTLRMLAIDAVHQLQAIVCRIAHAGAEQLSDFEPAGLQPDHRLGADRRRQDRHVAGVRALLRPQRHAERIERDAIDVAPELSHHCAWPIA